jgi:hypothetical protein
VVPEPAAVAEGPALVGELAPPVMPVIEPAYEPRQELPKTARYRIPPSPSSASDYCLGRSYTRMLRAALE